jgi:hypothetical protein
MCVRCVLAESRARGVDRVQTAPMPESDDQPPADAPLPTLDTFARHIGTRPETKEERVTREFGEWEAARKLDPSTPTPGWYPDPRVPDTERYWTGGQWSDVFRPVVKSKPTSVFAWVLCAVPLTTPLVAMAAPALYVMAAPTLVVAIVLNSVLAVLDEKKVREAGGPHVSVGLAIFLTPIYLIVRTRRVRSTPWIPVAWFAAFLVSIVALVTFAAVYSLSGNTTGTYIANQLDQQLTERGVRVSCPDMVGHAGDVFTCTAQDKTGSASVRVRIEKGGSYTWQLMSASS